MQRTQSDIRHPEVRAQRASKDAARDSQDACGGFSGVHGSRAREPAIGPRLARTRWRHLTMTGENGARGNERCLPRHNDTKPGHSGARGARARNP